MYFSLIDGDFKPSDEYLQEHELEGYEPGDTCHDDYDILDDYVALTCNRVCCKCGQSFTLDEAISIYNEHFDSDLHYIDDFTGDTCGSCAIEAKDREYDEQEGIMYSNESDPSISSKGWTDQTTCPDCGGDLFTSWNGYLECEDCHQQYAVDEDGVLFTEEYTE